MRKSMRIKNTYCTLVGSLWAGEGSANGNHRTEGWRKYQEEATGF